MFAVQAVDSQGRVRSDRVVVLAPLLDDDGGLLQAVEDFPVEAFVAQLAVEGLAVAILPGTAGLDVERLCSELCEPAAHDLGGHLRTVVRPDMLRHASVSITSAIVSMTPKLLIRRATLIARHSRVNSSIKVISRSLRPSWVCASTKS